MTRNTCSIHHYTSSWSSAKFTRFHVFETKIMKIFGPKVSDFFMVKLARNIYCNGLAVTVKKVLRLCEAAEVAALCLANLYNSGGHRKITPDEYETIKKYLQKFPESMHIRAAFIIASEAIYSPSAEYKRVPDKIINKAKQWSEQYPKKIEFQEAYFGLLFSRLKYAQAQDMRNEQRRVYREMKTVAERANYSEYNESNQLMESVDILHRVFGY